MSRCSYANICSYERRDDPPRGRRRLLRVRGAARRPAPARATRDRRGRGRARGELRGEGARGPHRNGGRAGPATLPPRRDRLAPDERLLGGEQGDVPRLRGRIAGGRGPLDRRGVHRRPRPRAAVGHPNGDRRASAPGRPREGRAPDHGRRRPDEVPGEGGERGREAGRSAGGAPRPRAGLPPPATGRAALGGRPGHGREAPVQRDQDGRRGLGARRGRARDDARPGFGTPAPLAGAQPRPTAR